MFKAIINFTDLQDNGTAYKAGDVYPRKGYFPTEYRIKELATAENKLGKPVIRYIEDKIEPIQAELAEEVPKRKNRKPKKAE